MQIAVKAASSSRIQALDFTKGALVLIMVLYHWLNYFVGPNLDYRYLRFLTPSFIFITGFLISQVYLSKYDKADPAVSRRLFTRGVKLLLIFIGLNAARTVLLSKLSNGPIMAEQLSMKALSAVFVVGNVPITTSKLVTFYILIPISYLLMAAAGLSFPYRRYKRTFHAVCLFCLVCILALGLTGIQSPNLEFITVGLLGVLMGFVPIERINSFVKRVSILIVAYLCYLVTITIWNVPFVLLIVGVCLTLWGIYFIGSTGAAPSGIRSQVSLLGKHSLFGYVIQIAILQVLSTAFRHVDVGPAAVKGISFVAAFALTIAMVGVVEHLKTKSIIADRLYKAAFA